MYYKLQADSGFAKQMETLYPGITKAVSPGLKGAFSTKSPANLTWHHNAHEPGLLELVPYSHHTAKGVLREVLHPGGKGGHYYWGGGKK